MSIPIDSSNDQVDDQVTEDLRLALLIGTQAAQQLVQRFTESQREAQRGAAELTRQFNAEIAAHKAIALAATQRVGDARWWNDTSPRDLAHAWEVAKVWEGRDPELESRLQAFREGLADRYGVTDPDTLTLRDLIEHSGSTEEQRSRLASPLAHAEWEAAQYGTYAQELSAEADRLRELAAQPTPDDRGVHMAPSSIDAPRMFEAGTDGTSVSTQEQWATSRLDVIEDLQSQAEAARDEATARADRLRGTGESTPARGPESQRAKEWDTPERREALRSRLARANVPPDAAQARLLTDRAQGVPPEAATWPAPKGKPRHTRPPRRPQPQHQRRR